MTLTLVGDSHNSFLSDYVVVERLPIKFKVCSGSLLCEPYAALNQDGEIEWTNAEVRERYGDPLKKDGGPIGVSIGYLLTMLATNQMWREHAPWRVSAQAGLRPMSDALFHKLAVEHAVAALAFLDLLASGGFDAFLVEPPPLKRLHPGVRAGTLPEVLREVDARWRLVMRDEYRKRDLRWIEAPTEAFDVDGFLKEEFSYLGDEDPHHANTPYAALIVPQILKFIDTA